MGTHDSLLHLRTWNQLTPYFGPISSRGQSKCLKNAGMRRMCHASAQFRQNKPICVHIIGRLTTLKTSFDFLQLKCTHKYTLSDISSNTYIKPIQKHKHNIHFLAKMIKTHALLYSCVQSVVTLPHVPRIWRTWFCACAICSLNFFSSKSDPWVDGRLTLTLHFGCVLLLRTQDVVFTDAVGLSSSDHDQSLLVSQSEELVYILQETHRFYTCASM